VQQQTWLALAGSELHNQCIFASDRLLLHAHVQAAITNILCQVTSNLLSCTNCSSNPNSSTFPFQCLTIIHRHCNWKCMPPDWSYKRVAYRKLF
jgi:hypothetical protein